PDSHPSPGFVGGCRGGDSAAGPPGFRVHAKAGRRLRRRHTPGPAHRPRHDAGGREGAHGHPTRQGCLARLGGHRGAQPRRPGDSLGSGAEDRVAPGEPARRGLIQPTAARRGGTQGARDKSPNRRLGEGTAASPTAVEPGIGRYRRIPNRGVEPGISPPTGGWGKVPPPKAGVGGSARCTGVAHTLVTPGPCHTPPVPLPGCPDSRSFPTLPPLVISPRRSPNSPRG